MRNSQKIIRDVNELLKQGLNVDAIASKLAIPRDQVMNVKYLFGEDVNLQDFRKELESSIHRLTNVFICKMLDAEVEDIQVIADTLGIDRKRVTDVKWSWEKKQLKKEQWKI